MPDASTEMACEAHHSFVEISAEALDLRKYTTLVADDGAGAVATFMGVTRDNFNGKDVLRLSYEAYGSMAEKEMEVGWQPEVHPHLTAPTEGSTAKSSGHWRAGDMPQGT